MNFKRLGGAHRLAVYQIPKPGEAPTPGPAPPQETCSEWQGDCGFGRVKTGAATGGKCQSPKCAAFDCCRAQCSQARCGAGRETVKFVNGRIALCDGFNCNAGSDLETCCQASCSLWQGCRENEVLNANKMCAGSSCSFSDADTCCSSRQSCAVQAVNCPFGKVKDPTKFCAGPRCGFDDQ